MNRLVFITRATESSGKGHFFRVLRMIEQLRHQCECILVSDFQTFEEGRQLSFYPYNPGTPEVVVRDLGLTSEDIIWFDLPDSDYQVISRFRCAGVPLVSTNMFEKKNQERFEDVAVYPIFEKNKKIGVGESTIQLSGAGFISVPEVFFRKNDPKRPSVLVSMGGTDPMGFTPLVCEAVAGLENSSLTYKIILPKGADANSCRRKYGNISHMEINEFGVMDFPEELKLASYALINGGMTRYECVAAETYFIALSIHEVQSSLTEKVSQYGYGKNFGVFCRENIYSLSGFLHQLPLRQPTRKGSDQAPSLSADGAAWMLDQVTAELKHENE